MNVRWFAAAAFFLMTLTVADRAQACTCAASPPQATSFANASLVFRGRVLHSTPATGNSLVEVGFEASRIWKGPVDLLKSLRTANNSAACGVNFQVGQEYVIYVEDQSMSLVFLCDRLRAGSQIEDEARLLGAGITPASATLPDVIRHSRTSGTWYNPARNGEGFIVDVLEGGRAVVTWFGYRPDDPQAQGWLTGVGQFTDDRLTVTQVTQPRGGGFGANYDPRAVQLIPWGSLTIDFSGNGSALVRWTSTLPGYGSGEISLQRLTRPPTVRPAP